MGILTDFAKGILVGFCVGVIIVGLTTVLISRHKKDKELSNYVHEFIEKQQVIETLREDYSNRDSVEFLDNIPAIRGAADGAATEFDRKRDEILQRFRSELLD